MSIIPPIALANYMIFMYTMYVYIEHYYKKTVYITKNTLIAAGLNVILNFILIPKYGYVAAAYTTLPLFCRVYFTFKICKENRTGYLSIKNVCIAAFTCGRSNYTILSVVEFLDA